jgi:hypothetical protein
VIYNGFGSKRQESALNPSKYCCKHQVIQIVWRTAPAAATQQHNSSSSSIKTAAAADSSNSHDTAAGVCLIVHMLLARPGSLAAGWCSSSRPCGPLLPAQQPRSRRATACHAKRGRPPKNKTTTEDAAADATAELEPAPAKRKGRKKKTEVEPAPTTAEAPLTVQMQPLPVEVSLLTTNTAVHWTPSVQDMLAAC